MSNTPYQMASYLQALTLLSQAIPNKATDNYGYRAALRVAWNLWDGLSQEEHSEVETPGELVLASLPS